MNRVQRRFVLDALDSQEDLTEWEIEFINSLADLDKERPDACLSEKQNEILNRIQRKIS